MHEPPPPSSYGGAVPATIDYQALCEASNRHVKIMKMMRACSAHQKSCENAKINYKNRVFELILVE